jgi:hypothetical protein
MPALLAAALAIVIAGTAAAGTAAAGTAAAGDATASAWTIEANLVVPDRSLKAHQSGPGLSLRWEHPLAPHWRITGSTGYLTLLTKQTPSYQMVPIQGGVKWVLRERGHSPWLAADLGLFPTVESFRFLFADQTVVTDDDAALYWGPGFALGYRIWHLEGAASYQLLLPRADDAGFFRFRLGYRF